MEYYVTLTELSQRLEIKRKDLKLILEDLNITKYSYSSGLVKNKYYILKSGKRVATTLYNLEKVSNLIKNNIKVNQDIY